MYILCISLKCTSVSVLCSAFWSLTFMSFRFLIFLRSTQKSYRFHHLCLFVGFILSQLDLACTTLTYGDEGM